MQFSNSYYGENQYGVTKKSKKYDQEKARANKGWKCLAQIVSIIVVIFVLVPTECGQCQRTVCSYRTHLCEVETTGGKLIFTHMKSIAADHLFERGTSQRMRISCTGRCCVWWRHPTREGWWRHFEILIGCLLDPCGTPRDIRTTWTWNDKMLLSL